MKKLLSLALLGLAAAAVACDQQGAITDPDVTPSFAIWDYKVTGGGLMESGATYFEVHASVTDATSEKGTVSGQIEYIVYNGHDLTTEVKKYHGSVDSFIAGEVNGKFYVNFCGTVDMQIGDWPDNQLGRFGIAIMDDPAGDKLRQNSIYIDCKTLYTLPSLFPGSMVDGDFRVKVDL